MENYLQMFGDGRKTGIAGLYKFNRPFKKEIFNTFRLHLVL